MSRGQLVGHVPEDHIASEVPDAEAQACLEESPSTSSLPSIDDRLSIVSISGLKAVFTFMQTLVRGLPMWADDDSGIGSFRNEFVSCPELILLTAYGTCSFGWV